MTIELTKREAMAIELALNMQLQVCEENGSISVLAATESALSKFTDHLDDKITGGEQ